MNSNDKQTIKYFDYLSKFSVKLEEFLGVSDLQGTIKFYRQNYSSRPREITTSVRGIAENLAKGYGVKNKLDVHNISFVDLIHTLYLKEAITIQDKELFDKIRVIGNKAAHGMEVTIKDAEICLVNLEKLLRYALYVLAKRPLNGYPRITDTMRIEQQLMYNTFERKLIYIQSANNETGLYPAYEGLEKIGDASVPDDLEADFTPNSNYLRKYAEKRINQYMNTAGVPYVLHWAQLAVDKEKKFFRDYAVHEVLKRSGIQAVPLGQDEHGKPNEWFRVSVEDAKKAINAVKEGKRYIGINETEECEKEIKFRPEQLRAIQQTKDIFKSKNEMLWNAKMRFGKTLSALKVIQEEEFKKVLIMTHRPVVSDGWFEDFGKMFKDGVYQYGSKDKGEKIENLVDIEAPFIYFASIQDLRGSQWAGGTHDKNQEFLNINWDLIIIDEAHEGNETELANNVKNALKNDTTKILELSGTPFNLFDKYDEDNIFTWDYTMEQEAKYKWAQERPNDPNPYDGLPKVSMYTYDIAKTFNYVDETKAFNFKEFFRSENGELAHREDVLKFLDQITTEDSQTNYPYSTETYRRNLRHTLWLLPGVAEANALEKMMKQHHIFKDYKIVNVVNQGDDINATDSDLEMVRQAIGHNPAKTKTITLTVRKLTTGVNVPEWTGVFFLNNTESPTTYLQAAFRAQTPFSHEEMGIKRNCYVFDFAPDRALKIMSESIGLTSKKGKINTAEQKEKMAKMLNFFPIIGQSGNLMVEFSVDRMLTQLKKAFAEKAVRSGFEDNSLYNDNLMGLNEADLSDFKNLKAIVGTSNATKNDLEVVISDNGFNEEEHDKAEKAERKPKNQRTPEEQEALDKLKQLRKQKSAMISILRGVSIRIPMMIYGMQVDLEEEISVNKFIKLVDDQSWEEFMPKGLTKAMFKKFTRYYDNEVFIEAGRIIRNKAKSYDKLDVIERTEKIAELFSTFKNPDKETVLTPWRVVNLQLISTFGGLSFYDKDFKNTTIDGKSALRWVGEEKIGQVYKQDIKILDINSKTGLYPLFMATSLYYQLMQQENENKAGKFDTLSIWKKVLKENIYAVAKTPMAKTITQRTLAGYQPYEINIEFIYGITELMKSELGKAGKKIEGAFNNVKFDVIIGNPPYQEQTIGDNVTFAPPIYHKFMEESYNLANKVSLITPARFLFNAGSTPKEWNKKMLNDRHLKVLYFEEDSSKVFPKTDIKGGVVITYRDKDKNFEPIEIFTRHPELSCIMKKVIPLTQNTLDSLISGRGVYKLSDTALLDHPEIEQLQSKGHKKDVGSGAFKILSDIIFFADKPDDGKDYVKVLGLLKSQRVYHWIDRRYLDAPQSFNQFKVIMPQANGNGAFGEVISSPLVEKPFVGATETFLSIGGFTTEFEANAALKYIKTKFVRAMLGILKITQANTRDKWAKVPLQDFTINSDIDWNKDIFEIDKQLYEKYGLDDHEISFIENNVKKM